MSNQLIHKTFENVAFKRPSATAVAECSGNISYGELNGNANYFARVLRDVGVEKDVVVGFLGSSGISAVTCLLSIFKSGGIYMPIDKTLPDKRIGGIISEIGCKFLIATNESVDQAKELVNSGEVTLDYLFVLDKEVSKSTLLKCEEEQLKGVPWPSEFSRRNLELEISPEDGNYIFYTSGSTGNGKPILGCHRSLAQFIAWEIKEFDLKEDLNVSHLSNIAFDAALRDVLVPLTVGGTLHIPKEEVRYNTSRLIEWVDENRINLIHMVPSILRLMNKELSQHAGVFKELQYIFMAGEKIYAKDVQTWRNQVGEHVELINLYGTSETTMAKTFHRIGAVSEDPGQVLHAGQPIDGAFVVIINNENKLCRIGEMGEIYIKTPFRSKGYYKRPDLTDERFVQNPLTNEVDILHKTGDLGRYGESRVIEVIGRKDDQVKINGIRIELDDIEQSILDYDGVEETIVILHKGRNDENELVAYYTGTESEEDGLRKHLEDNLSRHAIPGYLMKLDEFPLSPNGKINKKALPRVTEMVLNQGDYEKVKSGIESELEEVWKELLGLSQVGRNVSFFEIGGNSLKSIQMISKIYKAYNVLVKINEVFESNTIASLAAHISKVQKQHFETIPALATQEHYELSHAQKRFWIINEIEDNKSSYNVSEVYRINGNFELSVFERVVDALVERHEILRTTFVEVDGVPMQRVQSNWESNSVVDYRDFSERRDVDIAVEELMADTVNTVFDLENGPLFKVAIAKKAAEEYVFCLNIHHIISDAWSLEILAKEMAALYDSYINGNESPLVPLKIHYKDYAHWQNKLVDSLSFQDQRKYWLSHLSGGWPQLKLGANTEFIPRRSYEAKTVRFVVNNDRKSAIEEVTRQFDCSLFMTSLALLNTLFYKHRDQQDIVLGSPVAGREHPDLEDQVGLYINTVLFKNTVRGENTFSEFLTQLKNNTLDALKNQSYPLDLLADELGIEDQASLFDIGYTYFNEDMVSTDQPSEPNSLNMVEMGGDFEFVKASVWVKVVERKDDLIFVLTYAKDIYPAAFIEKLIVDMKYLIETIPSNLNTTLDDLIKESDKNLSNWEREKVGKLKAQNLNRLRALQANA